ncbi:unnamed protein product [Linum trigynum]|uniref:pectinesterase n=1 Tax=Linum trigynum TaxID=586398 RepID=A0AAV2D619_9ROSI
MESINFAKGYDKVRSSSSVHLEVEDQARHPQATKPIKKFRIAVVSAAVFLTAALAVMLFALIHHTNTEHPSPPENIPVAAATTLDSIRAVCNVTQHPDSCLAAISAAVGGNPKPVTDPEEILKVSIQVSLKRFADLASLFRNSSGGEWGSKVAVDDCVDQLGEGVSNLNQSLAAMEVEASTEGKMLTPAKIDDLKTWISAAMTDEETCGDGLEEMGAKVPEGVKAEMEECKQLLSNSLAILANMTSLLRHFHLQMH